MSQQDKLLALLIVLVVASCTTASFPPERSSTFTYSTYQGSVYQVELSGQKQQIIPDDGIRKRSLKWSSAQTRLAYIAIEFTLDGRRETLWVVDANGVDARPLFGPAKVLFYFWEKDNRTVYVEEAVSFERIPFDKDTIIRAYAIDVETGVVQKTNRRTELFPPPRESPDGNRAVWTDPAGDKWTLHLLDSQGNKMSVIYEPPPGRMTNGVWSPDSQQLAIIRLEDKEIYLYDVDTREWLKVSSLSAFHHDYWISNVQWSPDGEWLSYTLDDQERPHQICVLHTREGNGQCFDTQRISSENIWSRDSRHIAYLSKTPSEEIDIFVVDVAEGTITNLTQDGNSMIEDWIAQ